MIKTVGLTKKYDEQYAIQDIDLNLAAGDLFGFIGPNGAGKTTTMKILATLLQPSSGEAYVCEHSIYREPRERVLAKASRLKSRSTSSSFSLQTARRLAPEMR